MQVVMLKVTHIRATRGGPGSSPRAAAFQMQHLLRRRIQLLLQRFETIFHRWPAIERGEFVLERLAGVLVRRIQTRVRAGVGELNLVFELLKVFGKILSADTAERGRRRVL